MSDPSLDLNVLDGYGFALRYATLCAALKSLPDDFLVIFGDEPTNNDLNDASDAVFAVDDSLKSFVGFNGQSLHLFMRTGTMFLSYGPREPRSNDDEYAAKCLAIVDFVKTTLGAYDNIVVEHSGDPRETIAVTVSLSDDTDTL